MKRAKRNEVPKEYRRNYKEEFVEVLGMVAVCAMSITAFAALIILFA